jgi:hypothetical protein
MYLIDTNVISEYRKHDRANPGVQTFFAEAIKKNQHCFISVVTVGELRRGVELIKHRNDAPQAERLETWLSSILESYSNNILGIDRDTAQLWGKLRVPHPENALDKFIAATAIIYDLTLVTRNNKHFSGTMIKLHNPFTN